MMKAFNDLADFSSEEIGALIELAGRLDAHPEPEALKGKVLSLLFLSPSLRTLASFQAAIIVMDGVAAEHIREAVPVIASYGDAIGIRAFADRKKIENDLAETRFSALTELIDTPYINMESAMNHPCQSLADWKTMDDHNIPADGGKFVLSWAYHPKALPLAVPSATLHMAAKRGMDVTVLRPEGFELAKSWSSTRHYGDKLADQKLREQHLDWCVDEPWFDNAKDDCRFMHCLPVRRGVVVSDQILDGPRSIVIPEARNRMLAQMAVLHQMLGAKS
jgi:N-acetylornithine carbamoyltransferase